ncbi:hypothetical protein [Novispirillum itersonii]|uniref:hypothetical protein n=1 Tax=Novispirillum itersonii TaxID=189 RepID=UPI0012DDCFAA|nr:hypothetical protein [Novispirillum itersonii]
MGGMKSFILILCLLIAGCAPVSVVEPTGGNRARVRFVTNTEGITVLRAYEGENCSGEEQEWVRMRNGYLLTGSEKRLGIPLWSYNVNAAKELYVNTDKAMHGMFFGSESVGNYVVSCAVPFTFSFLPDHDYEVSYKFFISTCLVEVSEIEGNSQGGFRARQLSVFDNKLDERDASCKKHFRQGRRS